LQYSNAKYWCWLIYVCIHIMKFATFV
jgi:hypothetical protein